jgi:hypothetical protein
MPPRQALAPAKELSRAFVRLAVGACPVIDTVYALRNFRAGVARLEQRDVFGKFLVEL